MSITISFDERTLIQRVVIVLLSLFGIFLSLWLGGHLNWWDWYYAIGIVIATVMFLVSVIILVLVVLAIVDRVIKITL